MTLNRNYELFNKDTRAIVYGVQANAIQRMLDFDHTCGREVPSVAAIVNENKAGWHKVFWRGQEILLPMYRTVKRACDHHPEADVLVNFASFRSAYKTSLEALDEKTLNTVIIIAEGVPERYSRHLRQVAKEKNKMIIGPATVGGIAAGAFKIGNTGGTIDNIAESKLHRPGHVGFVSKSGGMSNEAYNIIARNTDGLYEGIAIGGDAYPGSTLFEHVMRYERNPHISMIVVLGEVGGEVEYEIVEALKAGQIKKPVVAWVTGTCARIFPASIQFGHAGARADGERETAVAKNAALRAAGAIVPESFDGFDKAVRDTYETLIEQGKVRRVPESIVPRTPMGYDQAVAQGVVRRKTNFTTTISDDRGDEPLYCGIPLSSIVENSMGIGDTIGLLWFKKKLPPYAARFIELVLVLVADHGPAVSGAHNTIVAARAGKDLMSSVACGMLTIGPRFGGAISGAAQMFKDAVDEGLSPEGFIRKWKVKGVNIQGIGHRIKSIHNPDKRVELLKDFARKNFPRTRHMDFALAVEKATTKKKDNLIFNVDGAIGVLFLDLMDVLGFSPKEIDDVVQDGGLDGLFVIGRSIGLIGHYFDQKRLKEGLYRHPWDDILYSLPSEEELG
ncbi:MAG: ATP citrate synthase [Myxococcota bacterium]|jgi:succinyl-CoA synthetase alpha subunit|nr:ATP citrate synthase [Myxococcota bacterium]